jgi:hypothetical protein
MPAQFNEMYADLQKLSRVSCHLSCAFCGGKGECGKDGGKLTLLNSNTHDSGVKNKKLSIVSVLTRAMQALFHLSKVLI